MKNYNPKIYYQIISKKRNGGRGTILNTFRNQYEAIKYFNEFPLKNDFELYLVKHIEELLAERGGNSEISN